MSHPHRRESLLTQLESMHKQLNDETRKKWSHNNVNERNGAGSGVLSRNERNSMPMFAGSSSHSGLLASNNSQDMSFVMGLSENLLVECRRLQAENESKKRKLETVKQDHEELKGKFQKLNNTHQIVVKELQSLRDTSWDLESKLQSVSVESRNLREKLNKNNRNLKLEAESAKQFKTDLEVSKLQLANLEKQLESTKNQHMAQLAELRKHVCELNDENDALHLKNRESNEKLQKSMDLEHSTSEALRSAQRDLKSANDIIAQLRVQIKAVDVASETQEEGRDGSRFGNNLSNDSEFSDVSERQAKEKMVLAENTPVTCQCQLVADLPDSEHDKLCAVSGNSLVQEDTNQDSVSNGSFPEQVEKIDHMAALLKDSGYAVIALTEYNDMMDKLKEYEKSTSEEIGFTIIDDTLYLQIQKNISGTSLAYLKQMAQKGEIEALLRWLANKRDTVLLDKKEAEKLERCFTAPTREFLDEKATSLGYRLIERDRFDEISRTFDNPSDDYLNQKANARGLSTVPSTELTQLIKTVETPDHEFLSKKASDLGYRLVQEDELRRLESTVHCPSLEFLKTKAKEKEYAVMDNRSYDTLVQQTTHPDLEFLKGKAAVQGYELMDKRLHDETQRKLLEPTQNELSEMASRVNCVVLLASEYEHMNALLKNPSCSYLQEKAQEQGLSLIPAVELERLKNMPKDKSEVFSMVRSFGFVPVSLSELEASKNSSLDNASLSDLKTRMRDMGYIAITEEEYKRYQCFNKESEFGEQGQTLAHCTKHGLDHEYETSDCEISGISLKEHISALRSHGYAAVAQSNCQQPESQLTSYASDHEIECLHKKASVPISKDTHAKLEHILDAPYVEYPESKENLSQPSLVSPKGLADNESKELSPTIEYLCAKAQEIGYGLLKLEDLNEMERKLSYMSCQKLDDFASDKKWMLVSEEEYYQTKNRLENPSIQELQAKSLQLGYIMLSVTEYDGMQREKIRPSEEYLAQKALNYNKLLVERTSYEALLLETNNPSEGFLIKHAASLGKVLVSESNYNEALERLTAPTHEFLVEKAANIGFALVTFEQMETFKALRKFQKMLEKSGFELTTTAEHDVLLNYTEISTGQGCEVKNGCRLAAEGTTAVQKIDEPLDIMKIMRSGSFVLLDKESYQSMLDACIKKVTKREVFDVCSKFNMMAIPSEEYEELIKEPTVDEIRTMAARHASVVVMRERFDMLKAQAEDPPDETIERCADRKGMVLVKRSDYESLMQRCNNPTKLEIEKQAEKLGMIAVASERYEHLLKELKNNSSSATPSPSSKVQAGRQYFEQVIRNQNKQSDKLYGPTKTLGFVTLSNEEYKKLKENQKSYTLTKTDIYKGAKEFSLAVLPLEEYKALLRKKLVRAQYEHDSPEESTANLDMKVVTFRMDSPTPLARKSVGGSPLRFHDQPSIALLDDYAACSEVRSNDTLDNHMQHDHSDQEIFISSVASTIFPSTQSPSRNSKDLAEEASTRSDAMLVSSCDAQCSDQVQSAQKERPLELEQQQVPELIDASNSREDNYLDDFTDLDEDTLIKEAKKKDLVLITRVDYEKFLAAAESTTTREALETEASKLNLVVLEKQEYKELLDKHEIDVCYVEKLARQFGLRAIPKEYLRQLKTTDTLTVDNVEEQIADLNCFAPTASKFDNQNEKAMAQRDEITQESISSKSSLFKLEAEPKIIETALKDESSNEQVEDLHMHNTIESLPEPAPVAYKSDEQNEFNCDSDIGIKDKEMPADLSADDILRWAPRFKLVPIELEHFEQIKEELSNPTLAVEEIMEQAKQHNLVAIPADVYEELRNSSKDGEQDIKTVEMKSANDDCEKDMTFDAAIAQLKVIADRFHLFRSPEEALEDYKLFGCSSVVVLPDVYYNELLHSQRELAKKVTEEKTRSKNQMLGSKVSPTKPKAHNLSQPAHNGGSKVRKQTSMSSPKSPAQSATVNAQKAPIKLPKSLSHSAAFMSKHSRGSSVARNNSTASSSIERSNSMGALSLATVASLSEPSIIPALTQTVIGEYLYKYYQYFGPFGLNSRHERFFWVHPYTLTLYWSTTNPVLSNPANHKTKCAAIISVESVVDTNPYPAGLYHKSIIITTDNKTIKITCATRQRHNIWYNSLRYLVQRNMEGISLEAIADDPSDTMYSGKIFPLPGENSKSASRRLSSSRRSVRARIPKSTSMPMKKND
ncbi:hypothetical protein HG537_0H01260 [Torulaspora globosa]|uniref:PH domain-containing protein n=1 Tax=Torulaspora globosa TaxID=48254 RepID=A0A7H9HXA6_9SACH|nr:hypothetical protein HG537_0H01260 [Torulaspora sp. CBS 2947]